MSSARRIEKGLEMAENAGAAAEAASGHFPAFNIYKRVTTGAIKHYAGDLKDNQAFRRIMSGRSMFLSAVGLMGTALVAKHLFDKRKDNTGNH